MGEHNSSAGCDGLSMQFLSVAVLSSPKSRVALESTANLMSRCGVHASWEKEDARWTCPKEMDTMRRRLSKVWGVDDLVSVCRTQKRVVFSFRNGLYSNRGTLRWTE